MSGKKPVPPKLPNQQILESTSQAKNPGQLVPASSASIASRYVMSSIPRPNYERPVQPSYSSALASSAPKQTTLYTVDDPFSPLQSQRPSQPLSRRNRSPYFKKPYIQHISYIEPHIVHIKDSLALAMEVFPEGWHFLPRHPEKNIKYYRQILVKEESARVENIMNKADPSVVLYHKFIITGFISSKEWGQHPSLLKTFKGLKSITVPQIFPDCLQDTLRYFSSRYKLTPHSSQFLSILHMTVKYRIHWISMWNYDISGNLLNREFSVKWWDFLKIDSVISQVYKDFPLPVQRNIVTRSQSSLDSSQFAGKSSKELKDLA
ncbi:hypothetical protein SO802_012311 [Lithocarpus litseifolius]|uniref:Uncharacterized protein n=1 Tax=Lithocarpus litseifolius TaxID=425828 RepID=A0AAW2D6G2_9ROSI